MSDAGATGLSVGSRVRHRRLGVGVVLQTRYRGYECWVEFAMVRTWVRGTDLTVEQRAAPGRRVGPASGMPVSAAPPQLRGGLLPPLRSLAAMKLAKVEATFADRCVIEAFRLGTVPDRYVTPWTFGRDDELSHLFHWLDDQADGSMLLEGAYGSGKSHLLQALAARALEDGWVVSTSHLDAGEESAAFPKRLYRQIARGLVAPGLGGFEQLVLAAVDAAGHNPVADHPILGPLADRILAGTDATSDWNAALGEGDSTAVTGYLPDFTTSANVYCNLISGLGWLSAKVLGFKGLLVLVDEVETASACLYRFHFQRAQSFFRGLTLTANDDPDLLDDAPKKGATAYEGSKTGLVYAGHRRMPYLYRTPSALKVVLASTPGPMRGQYAQWRGEQTVLEIEAVRTRALQKLAEKLAAVYVSHFGVEVTFAELAMVATRLVERFGTTRTFIKALVEILDYRRFHPGEPIDAPLRR